MHVYHLTYEDGSGCYRMVIYLFIRLSIIIPATFLEALTVESINFSSMFDPEPVLTSLGP